MARGSTKGAKLVTVGGGIAVFLAGARRARRLDVDPGEERAFRWSNDVADSIHPPLWVVMQLGSLGGVIVSTVAAYLAGRRVTAAGVGGGGFFAWLFCKLVKRYIGRGRPAAHLVDVRVRGQAQTGLGYPSGHTAVATTMALIAGRASPRARAALLVPAAAVGWSRMYVGAHLPLDIVGGAAVGVATGAATNHLLDRHEGAVHPVGG
jgi:membrane-associated phospholipid phosphatase